MRQTSLRDPGTRATWRGQGTALVDPNGSTVDAVMLRTALLFVAVAAFGVTGPASAQRHSGQHATATAAQAIKRTPPRKFDVPGTGHETVIGLADIAPNVSVSRYTHPGPESGFLLEGEFTLPVEEQPVRPLITGHSYVIPAGIVHEARSGERGAKVIATYVVEKGKPLATPVPQQTR